MNRTLLHLFLLALNAQRLVYFIIFLNVTLVLKTCRHLFSLNVPSERRRLCPTRDGALQRK